MLKFPSVGKGIVYHYKHMITFVFSANMRKETDSPHSQVLVQMERLSLFISYNNIGINSHMELYLPTNEFGFNMLALLDHMKPMTHELANC